MWMIPEKDLATFRATNREQCGVIVVSGNQIVRVEHVRNVAESNEDYAILMGDLRKVESSLTDAERILGFLHTHLAHHDPSPSDRDYEGSKIFPTYTNCVYHPSTGSLSWYGILTEEPTDVGRQVAIPTLLPQLAKERSDESDVAEKLLCLSSHI